MQRTACDRCAPSCGCGLLGPLFKPRNEIKIHYTSGSVVALTRLLKLSSGDLDIAFRFLAASLCLKSAVRKLCASQMRFLICCEPWIEWFVSCACTRNYILASWANRNRAKPQPHCTTPASDITTYRCSRSKTWSNLIPAVVLELCRPCR